MKHQVAFIAISLDGRQDWPDPKSRKAEMNGSWTLHSEMPNGEGFEFLFTLMRQSGMSDEQFAKDKTAVEMDLHALKGPLERDSGK